MLELGTLGGLAVSGPIPLGKAAVQPRRLALLALLADAGSRGLSRDTLIGYLWQDQDAEGARHNLTQTLYALRRDLSADSLFLGTSRLSLNPEIIACDLWRFTAACAAGRWEEAAGHYKGPFLAGFHLAEAQELDRWCEQRRLAYSADACLAFDRVAAAAVAGADHAEAVRWYRRLAGLEPHNARVTAQLARAMRDSGDRAGAISLIHDFGTRVREDLALPLDATLVSLADEIRAELRSPAGSPKRPRADGQGGLPEQAPPGGGPPDPQARPRRWPRWGIPLAAAAVLAVVAAVNAGRRVTREPPAGSAGLPLAVLPFEIRGDSAPAWLSEGMARLVANGLDGVGTLRASVYPEADALLDAAPSGRDTTRALERRFRLERYVSGEAVLVNGTLQVRAELHDATRQGRLLGVALATGPVDSLFSVAERVARKLLGLDSGDGPGSLIQSASENTSSLAAFQAFIEAEGHFRASRWGDAVAAYQRAVREDSTFALAWFRLGEAADWNAQAALATSATETASRLATRLPERARMLLEAAAAWRGGHDDAAEQTVRLVTARYPNDVEAWSLLAEVLFHANNIRGRSFVEAGAPFERVLRLDPANRGALTHLARVRAYRGDAKGSDSLLGAAAARIEGGLDPEMAMFRAVVTGDAAGQRVALQRLATGQSFVFINAVHRLLAFSRDPAMADSVLAHVARAGVIPNTRRDVYFFQALVAATLGQHDRALSLSGALAGMDARAGLEVRGLLMGLPYSAWPEPLRRTTRAAIAAADSSVLQPVLRLYLLGELDLQAGDTARVKRWIDSLEAAGTAAQDPRSPRAFAGGLNARLLALRGDTAAALAQLELGPTPDPAIRGGLVGNMFQERLLRARLLEKTGRQEEALGTYASLVFGEPINGAYAIPAALLRARLLARMGRREEARLEYRTVVRAWDRADARLRPVVDSAARELAALK